MSIFPLQQFEADVAQAEREAYERLKAPTSIVVRFGRMRMVGEFPYKGEAKPGCGSKIVVRTHRGTEIGEMLTSTCPNAGCSKSVTRQEMLQYIENSGGRDYPFFSDGRALRVASVEDMNRQSALEAGVQGMVKGARAMAEALGLPMRVIDAEPILGGERLTFYFTSEDRVDFRDLARDLAAEHKARIELRQVGARDEARINADYERCGQHCCCKQFLKVLKPVSMRSAKVQKATLDPLKISGRCGRLMCCLRYEDETYEDLRKRLPKRKTRVGTPEGPGLVMDGQILTQLVLVELEADQRHIAVPLEELITPEEAEALLTRKAEEKRRVDPLRGMSAERVARRTEGGGAGGTGGGGSRRDERPRREERGGRAAPGAGAGGRAAERGAGGARGVTEGAGVGEGAGAPGASGAPGAPADGAGKKRRRRRGRRGRTTEEQQDEFRERAQREERGEGVDEGTGGDARGDGGGDAGVRASEGGEGGGGSGGTGGDGAQKKRRRRRRRRGGGGGGGGGGGDAGGGGAPE